MDKLRLVKLLPAVGNATRTPNCQFSVSSCYFKKAMTKSVFERFQTFQQENNIAAGIQTEAKNSKQIITNCKVDDSETENNETVILNDNETDINSKKSTKIDSDKKGKSNKSSKTKKTEYSSTDENLDKIATSKSKKSKTVLDVYQNIIVEEAEKPIGRYVKKNKSNELENNESSLDLISRASDIIRKPGDPFNFLLDCSLFDTFEKKKSKEFLNFRNAVESIEMPHNPTVSRILGVTKSQKNKGFLLKWKQKIVDEYGDEGFEQVQKETKEKGSNLHDCIHQVLSGLRPDEIDVPKSIHGYWNSLQSILNDIYGNDVKALETRVTHPLLFYKGMFDCITYYGDTLCLIDWKTSKKPKPLLADTFDNPLQLAAYLGAVNSSPNPLLKQFAPLRNAAIVIAYQHGEPAEFHFLTEDQCIKYWNQWLCRLYKYYTDDQVRSSKPF